MDGLKRDLGIGECDGFLVLAAPEEKMDVVIDQIVLRIEHIRDEGIPIDTRLATQNGETKFLRPRPGAARMYPETDVPPIIISKVELDEAAENIPKPWDDSIRDLQTEYQLNSQLSGQLFDSSYFELFETIAVKTKVNPTFVASVLCSTITNLERSGLGSKAAKRRGDSKDVQVFRGGKDCQGVSRDYLWRYHGRKVPYGRGGNGQCLH